VALVSPGTKLPGVVPRILLINNSPHKGIEMKRLPMICFLFATVACSGAASSSLDFPSPVSDAGTQGLIGRQGPAGPQGLMGEAGSQGPQGKPGLNGEAGAQGEQGVPGLNGTNGEAGPPGQQGPMGIQGQPGINGTDGLNGEAGVTGPQGEAGSNETDAASICSANLTYCSNEGICADLSTSFSNCGSCGCSSSPSNVRSSQWNDRGG
jgi:hypothetical protein